MNTPRLTPWPAPISPTETTLRQFCSDEGLNPYPWSSKPHDMFPAHMHSYDKVIYVLNGSITFNLPQFQQQFALKVGDRLDLPAGIVHEAVVGEQGVVCLEAHRRLIETGSTDGGQ